jgi:hypothetical protein
MALIFIRLLCQGRQTGFHGLVAARTRQAGEDEPWTPLRKAVFAVALREGDERGRHRIEAIREAEAARRKAGPGSGQRGGGVRKNGQA